MAKVDLLFEVGEKINVVEIKSGATIHTSFLKSLKTYKKYAGEKLGKVFIAYGGSEAQKRTEMTILPSLKLVR